VVTSCFKLRCLSVSRLSMRASLPALFPPDRSGCCPTDPHRYSGPRTASALFLLQSSPRNEGSHRMNSRLVALDVGDKRIGVAISDALRLTAQPLGTIERQSLARDCSAIEELLKTYDVEKIIAGLPLNSRGEEGEQADRVRHFCERLIKETGRVVVYQDERLTTAEGERMLIESGIRRNRRKEVRDRVAAALILQAWLDSQPRT